MEMAPTMTVIPTSRKLLLWIPDLSRRLSTDGLDEGDYTVYAYQNAS